MVEKRPKGRPKSKNPLIKEVRAKISENLYNAVYQYCVEEDMDVSELIRKCLRDFLKKEGRI